MRVVVTGASGMIGSTLARVISGSGAYDVIGVGRRKFAVSNPGFHYREFPDLSSEDAVRRLYSDFCPDTVINCAGLTKHHPSGGDPVEALRANALLPHFLSAEAETRKCRFIHISTDCVFRGDKGHYLETSLLDAEDIYGKSKGFGELIGDKHLVLRTSTIGHETGTSFGLLEWFLGTAGKCRGFSNAFFSGLPTIELANLLIAFILPHNDLAGLYNIGGKRIDKHSLLRIIADIYGHDIEIIKDPGFVIDRSLDSSKFLNKTGYKAPDWRELIEKMFADWSARKNDI